MKLKISTEKYNDTLHPGARCAVRGARCTVRGAWEAAWSWDETRLVLQQHGHKVTAIDLPGTRANERAVAQVTMDSYVQTVADVIKEQGHKVTLVGHSLAGAVISQVAEFTPEKIERLIYAAGFLLKDGDSVIEAMQRDPDGEFLPELVFSEDQSSVTAAPHVWRDKAFHDVEETKILDVLPLVDHAQSTEPFAEKVQLSKEKFGSVPKIYVRTALDKMVSPKLQDEMVGNWNVDEVHVLQAGHFPTLSMPEKLAELMLHKVLEPA